MGAESVTQLSINVLNGLALGMLLFLLATGLSLIFGMMDFINLAHGSLYMLGAYLAFTIVRSLESFWLALVLVPIVVGLIGVGLELSLLRPLYRRGHLDQVLLTFGLAFVIADLVKVIWGAEIRSLAAPVELRGVVPVFAGLFPKYRLFVIGAGLVLAAALWLVQSRTRVGAIIRAGVADKEMVAGLGINVSVVFSGAFAVGAGLAAMSGVIAGPFLSLSPGMDFDQLILSLIVVVLGGLGTLRGSFWGAVIIGQADTFGKIYLPEFSLAFIFALMAAVLLLRPRGLFGKAVG